MGRNGEQMPQAGENIRQKTEKREDQPAQSQKISASPQGKSHPLIDSQLAISPEDGKEKQHENSCQPKEQIHQHGHEPPGKTLPGHPQQVIEHPQARTHCQSLQKVDPLGRHIHPHGQRSSRASRELPRSRRSSS